MQKDETFVTSRANRLNLFLPVCFACGIAFYFSLPFEPYLWIGLISFFLSLIGFIFIKNNFRLFLLGVIFFISGFVRINLQTAFVDAPKIHKKYSYVTIIGKIQKLEKYENAQRITLTDLTLDKVPNESVPTKIRIRINGMKTTLQEGDIVSLKANLMPPTLPFLPEGYPHNRTAFYNKIGATGYAMNTVKIIERKQPNIIQRIRTSIRDNLVRTLPKEQAAVATALITGDQGLVSDSMRDLYTTAGIVHILSVSGFHMAMIAGFIFFIFRLLFLLFPNFSSYHNTKKISAFLALIVLSLYLPISGMAVPAVRAFGMVCLILLAVLFDRRVVSLHSVFWIGFLVLAISPQVLMTASFILSFMAVIALVGCYEMFYPRLANYFSSKSFILNKLLFPIIVMLLMNLVAHLATAPIVIYYFHKYANYTVLGNFLVAPVFGLLILPLLFCGVLLIPFGLAYPFFWCVGLLLYDINLVCKWLSSLPFANIHVLPLSDLGCFTFILGFVCLFLLRGRFRLIAIPFVLGGILTLFFYKTPDILINQGGKLWAVYDSKRSTFSSLNKYKQTRYAWMEVLGSSYKRDDNPIRKVKWLTVRFDGYNDEKADIVFNTKVSDTCKAKMCISRKKLWKEGTHAVYIKDGKFEIKSVADGMKNRPWGQ